MQNVVSLRSDRPRPQRVFDVPRSGARILFFTGVRYCRDGGHGDECGETGEADLIEAGCGAHLAPPAARPADAMAH